MIFLPCPLKSSLKVVRFQFSLCPKLKKSDEIFDKFILLRLIGGLASIFQYTRRENCFQLSMYGTRLFLGGTQ